MKKNIKKESIERYTPEGISAASFVNPIPEKAVLMFDDEKREQYKSFKLEGIMEAPLNICVTCDRKRFGPVVIGRTSNRIMDIFSSVCAVQNLWLAARAEGLGVGWVSILRNSEVTEILKLPSHIMPVAYLCVGYVTHFPEIPELEAAGWLPRVPLEKLVFCDEWGKECQTAWPDLFESITSHQKSFKNQNINTENYSKT